MSRNSDLARLPGSGGTVGALDVSGTLDVSGNTTLDGTGVSAQGMPIVTENTTTRTLATTDNGKYIRCTNASGCTVTIPTNASAAIPIGAEIVVFNASGGTVTIAGTGITKFQLGDQITDQGGAATLKKVDTDTWDILGALT